MTPTTIERLKQADSFRVEKKGVIYVYCNYNKYQDTYESVRKSDYRIETLVLKRGSKVFKL